LSPRSKNSESASCPSVRSARDSSLARLTKTRSSTPRIFGTSCRAFHRNPARRIADPVEEFVQTNEVRPLHVPMRLFELQLEINGIGQALIHQCIQFHPPLYWQVIFGFVHFGSLRDFLAWCFHRLSVLIFVLVSWF